MNQLILIIIIIIIFLYLVKPIKINYQPAQEDIQDTILHEIAHAIVGPKHGHDKVWKVMASKLGCSAKRCHTLEFSDYKWIRFCANHCWKQKVHRRKSNLICKKCGSPVQYQQNI